MIDIVIIDGLSFALPLFIMAIGGIYCERSGITNLALEGLQGAGAFVGALAAIFLMEIFGADSSIPPQRIRQAAPATARW
jgi:simple sugar transport system permease protein